MSVTTDRRRPLKRADPSTIQNKFLVGYQGWFTCGGDGPPVHKGHHGWLHWFNQPLPDGGRPNTDIWPDVSEYSTSELYPAPGLTNSDGSQTFLFSSRNPRTVQRHFHWMAQHSVDGAFLQRFGSHLEVDGKTAGGNVDRMRLRDEIGDRVKEAAEKEGRVFAIMYDVSGIKNDRLEKVVTVDWQHLIHDQHILDSPNYLREKGQAVVAIWGIGFANRNQDPAIVRRIIHHLKANTPGGAYIMAGAPANWQVGHGDSDTNPEFLDLFMNEFDAVSPWTIGRYGNIEGANRFYREKISKDVEAIKARGAKVDYVPVIHPGGSDHNLSDGRGKLNGTPRDGGNYVWAQIANVRRAGIGIVYGAMWDEYDEGTAYLPIVRYTRQLPKPGNFVANDADGLDLPTDWYMRICGLLAESLHSKKPVTDTLPKKELDDYWSSRPHYEDGPLNDSLGQAGPSNFEAWNHGENEGSEAPPPPYDPGFEAGASTVRPPVPGTVSEPPLVCNSTRPTVRGDQIQPSQPPPTPSSPRPPTSSPLQPTGPWSSAAWPPPDWVQQGPNSKQSQYPSMPSMPNPVPYNVYQSSHSHHRPHAEAPAKANEHGSHYMPNYIWAHPHPDNPAGPSQSYGATGHFGMPEPGGSYSGPGGFYSSQAQSPGFSGHPSSTSSPPPPPLSSRPHSGGQAPPPVPPRPGPPPGHSASSSHGPPQPPPSHPYLSPSQQPDSHPPSHINQAPYPPSSSSASNSHAIVDKVETGIQSLSKAGSKLLNKFIK